jgi:hypothetical protein
MTKRRLDGKRWNRFYKTITREPNCVYCGVRATCRDHFLPLSVMTLIADSIEHVRGKVLIPSCAECNALAGNKVFPTIAAKRRYIQSRIRKRYRQTLGLPAWSDHELDELGYALNDFVQAGLEKQRWLLERLAWRNTSNSDCVQLAAVRSPFAASGRNSAMKPAVSHGTTPSAEKSSPLGDQAD